MKNKLKIQNTKYKIIKFIRLIKFIKFIRFIINHKL